ncbi:MAG TPA: hypothetical protein IAB13_08465 [Candidatus Avanaerovorax faecigallinarum]|nr:hypothetical protein [Candidatus Avanaerovorax faecigallinarum]
MRCLRTVTYLILVFALIFTVTACENGQGTDGADDRLSTDEEVQNELSFIDTADEEILSYFFFDDSQYCVYRYSVPEDFKSLDVMYGYYDNGTESEQMKLITVDFSKHENGRRGTISVYKSGYNEYALMWASEDNKSKEVCYDVTFKENVDGVRTEYNRFPKEKIETGVKYPVFLSVNSDEGEDDSMQEGRMTFDGLVSQNRNINALYLIFN